MIQLSPSPLPLTLSLTSCSSLQNASHNNSHRRSSSLLQFPTRIQWNRALLPLFLVQILQQRLEMDGQLLSMRPARLSTCLHPTREFFTLAHSTNGHLVYL